MIGLDSTAGSRDLTFVGNLVAETGGELVDTYDDPAMWDVYNEIFDCLIVHEGSLVAARLHRHHDPAGLEPLLRRPRGPRLPLGAGSAPIDFCDTLYYSPGLDIDLQPRGYDDPAVVGLVRASTTSAPTSGSPVSLLFADGFETGNTSHWSATSP